jgi:ribosomal protein S12 methylthiotransferase accessory factor
VLELRQTEVSLGNCLRRWGNEGSSPPLPGEDASRAWLAGASSDRLPWLLPAGRIAAPAPSAATTIGASVERCRRALGSAGLRAYRLELTREDVRVPVTKIVVPGACHRRPRLGLPRLWHVPVALGWQRPAPTGAIMQPFPLLI